MHPRVPVTPVLTGSTTTVPSPKVAIGLVVVGTGSCVWVSNPTVLPFPDPPPRNTYGPQAPLGVCSGQNDSGKLKTPTFVVWEALRTGNGGRQCRSQCQSQVPLGRPLGGSRGGAPHPRLTPSLRPRKPMSTPPPRHGPLHPSTTTVGHGVQLGPTTRRGGVGLNGQRAHEPLTVSRWPTGGRRDPRHSVESRLRGSDRSPPSRPHQPRGGARGTHHPAPDLSSAATRSLTLDGKGRKHFGYRRRTVPGTHPVEDGSFLSLFI